VENTLDADSMETMDKEDYARIAPLLGIKSDREKLLYITKLDHDEEDNDDASVAKRMKQAGDLEINMEDLTFHVDEEEQEYNISIVAIDNDVETLIWNYIPDIESDESGKLRTVTWWRISPRRLIRDFTPKTTRSAIPHKTLTKWRQYCEKNITRFYNHYLKNVY
jgi:hypothetical protein